MTTEVIAAIAECHDRLVESEDVSGEVRELIALLEWVLLVKC